MKSIICSYKFHRPKQLLLSAALTLTTLCTGLTPSLANSQREIIAQKMVELQQSEERWIQVDLSQQRLIAWEGGKPVYAITISTGKDSTPTRTGSFTIQSKHRVARMQGADYDVPNVPYTMYYHRGYALHGAYWHRKFGTPVSHGCINLAVNHAKWLFNWAGVGTSVIVHK